MPQFRGVELRLGLINLAQRDWAESNDWEALYKEVNTLTSQATGNASIALPSDFRKFAGSPVITADGTTTDEYPIVNPRTRQQYSSTDKYCYFLGSSGDYTLVVHPASLISGASIFYSYYSTPTDLATVTDVSPIPDPNYLIQAAAAKLFAIDEDQRTVLAQREADSILKRMLESENTKGEGYQDRVKTVEERRYNFRWGRN